MSARTTPGVSRRVNASENSRAARPWCVDPRRPCAGTPQPVDGAGDDVVQRSRRGPEVDAQHGSPAVVMSDGVDDRVVVLVLLALEPGGDARMDLGPPELGHRAVRDLADELRVELPRLALDRQQLLGLEQAEARVHAGVAAPHLALHGHQPLDLAV